MKYTTALVGLAATVSAQGFTSIFNITATPDQVVNASSLPAPGQPGATGQFNYAIDSKSNTICYNITLYGVSGTYQSPALTATHIHEAVKGRNGPPRIAFPNPIGNDQVRNSNGCIHGPFLTGIKMADNITDTGAGFTLAMIEANPASFFTDSHTNLFVPGVVRGQLDQSFTILPQITTATLTATHVSTITSCPTTVIDCPFTTKPVTTTTAYVYTTVCPVSELSTLPGYVSTKPAATHIYVSTHTGSPTSTHNVPAHTDAASATSTRPVFTGAANANAVGGIMMAAGLVAALF